MNLKILAIVLIFFSFIELIVIIYITKNNHEIFSKYTGLEYSLAVNELCKKKPIEGFILKLAYGLALVGVVVMLFAKMGVN